MKKSCLKAFLVLFLSMILISPALAQRQTGSIKGVVVDDNGEPLPGVALSISSPALQGTHKEGIPARQGGQDNERVGQHHPAGGHGVRRERPDRKHDHA